jgi:ABC-type multidrug transport system permease subunit
VIPIHSIATMKDASVARVGPSRGLARDRVLQTCRVTFGKILSICLKSGEIYAVNFGFVASLVVVIFAVISVFIEIPVVSNYAFWFAVGAYIMLAGTR